MQSKTDQWKGWAAGDAVGYILALPLCCGHQHAIKWIDWNRLPMCSASHEYLQTEKEKRNIHSNTDMNFNSMDVEEVWLCWAFISMEASAWPNCTKWKFVLICISNHTIWQSMFCFVARCVLRNCAKLVVYGQKQVVIWRFIFRTDILRFLIGHIAISKFGSVNRGECVLDKHTCAHTFIAPHLSLISHSFIHHDHRPIVLRFCRQRPNKTIDKKKRVFADDMLRLKRCMRRFLRNGNAAKCKFISIPALDYSTWTYARIMGLKLNSIARLGWLRVHL